MKTMTILTLTLLGSTCEPPPPVEPTNGPPWPPTPEGACYALDAVGCPEAKPTSNGVSCPTVLRNASKLRDMKIVCISEARSQDEARQCGTVRCRQ